MAHMKIKEMREASGMTQEEFSKYFNIPKRDIENWEEEKRECKPYWSDLMVYKLINEGLIKTGE